MAKKQLPAVPVEVVEQEFGSELAPPAPIPPGSRPIAIDELIGAEATQLEFGVGCHLMGQTLTLSSSRGSKLTVTQLGVLAVAKSGRTCLLPWANLKCVELRPSSKIKGRPTLK